MRVSDQRDLYGRIVATNNRSVTRDYGTHVEEVVSVGGKYDKLSNATDEDYARLASDYDGKILSMKDHGRKARVMVPKAPISDYKPPAVLELGKFGRSRFE